MSTLPLGASPRLAAGVGPLPTSRRTGERVPTMVCAAVEGQASMSTFNFCISTVEPLTNVIDSSSDSVGAREVTIPSGMNSVCRSLSLFDRRTEVPCFWSLGVPAAQDDCPLDSGPAEEAEEEASDEDPVVVVFALAPVVVAVEPLMFLSSFFGAMVVDADRTQRSQLRQSSPNIEEDARALDGPEDVPDGVDGPGSTQIDPGAPGNTYVRNSGPR